MKDIQEALRTGVEEARSLNRYRMDINALLPEDVSATQWAHDISSDMVYIQLTHTRTGTTYLMRVYQEVLQTPALLKTAVQNALREGWGSI